MEYPVEAVLPYETEEEVMNINILPLPPIFSGTNFASWATEMKAGFREQNLWELVERGYEEPPTEEAYEALSLAQKEELRILRKNDAGALYSIQIALDDSIMMLILGIETSKDAWDFLQREFGERGSSQIEAADVANETDHVSVSHTEHVSSEISETHSPVKLVDEDVDDEDSEATASPAVCMDNPAILIADEVIENVDEEATQEVATQEVAGQPLMAETEIDNKAAIAAQLVDEELIRSLPVRAVVFTNHVSNFADFNIYQLVADGEYPNEEADEIIQEFLMHVNSLSEAENDKETIKGDNSLKDAKHGEEKGSHIAAEDEEMCIEDAQDGVSAENNAEKQAESIFQKWSQEEIKYYYQLMWQQATAEDELAMRAEHSMREHADLKIEFEAQAVMGITQLKDDETWQQPNVTFENIDDRVKLKPLEEKQRKKVKMKRPVRRIGKFRVWSRRKKKKLPQHVAAAKQIKILKHVSLAET